ncbi:MAG: insulinase family protein [Clostridia bacterium]|jgi:predicted Zn-dependent peptidase|nr:insulinase family protein [Clostridia bacterium]
MQIIENKLIKEKVYIEKLNSGFTIMCIPKSNTRKKYAICGVGYGSNDNRFIKANERNETVIPDGVAHYLEHKMFEQESGVNSLDTLSSLGVEANAYTTNDHTAYLFECTNNFDKAIDELLNYVQNPYFTDQNVEKEKDIISQEIKMYEDEPEWKVYINSMKALYQKNPIRIDVAGSVESIQKITKETLYECYNNFYIPENMILILVGNFEPEKTIEEMKSKLTMESKIKAKTIEEKEENAVNQKEIIENMDISVPIFAIGYKINPDEKEKVKRSLSIEILLEILFGESTEFYKKIYEKGLVYEPLTTSFEWSRNYAHVLIQGKSENVDEIEKIIKERINQTIKNGIDEKAFERAKRKIYGLYVKEFNNVDQEAILFVSNYFKKINPFEYIENYKIISKEYLEKVLKEAFKDENSIKSCIKPQKNS